MFIIKFHPRIIIRFITGLYYGGFMIRFTIKGLLCSLFDYIIISFLLGSISGYEHAYYWAIIMFMNALYYYKSNIMFITMLLLCFCFDYLIIGLLLGFHYGIIKLSI